MIRNATGSAWRGKARLCGGIRGPPQPCGGVGGCATAGHGSSTSRIRKLQDDSFAGTPLAGLLATHEVRALAICGLMSGMCVSATARTALARGLRVVLPHDAHSTTGIPATATAPAIPAETVSRVAEWALGDELEVVEHATEVSFSR